MPNRRQIAEVLVLSAALVAVALGTGGCRGGDEAASAPSQAEETIARQTIPQPAVDGLSVAPESNRVDLALPTFSEPTRVDNPLFPVSSQASVLLLGRVDGQPFGRR